MGKGVGKVGSSNDALDAVAETLGTKPREVIGVVIEDKEPGGGVAEGSNNVNMGGGAEGLVDAGDSEDRWVGDDSHDGFEVVKVGGEGIGDGVREGRGEAREEAELNVNEAEEGEASRMGDIGGRVGVEEAITKGVIASKSSLDFGGVKGVW